MFPKGLSTHIHQDMPMQYTFITDFYYCNSVLFLHFQHWLHLSCLWKCSKKSKKGILKDQRSYGSDCSCPEYSVPLTAVWTDCCFRHSAAEMLLVACYCLVFDPPTHPTCVTSDVSLRRVCACIQVPADILFLTLVSHDTAKKFSLVCLWDKDCSSNWLLQVTEYDW